MTAEDLCAHLPPPPPHEFDVSNTVWVGNISSSTTEYTLLQLFKKYGKLEKFELPYHKADPNRGQHRGFCFVSYQHKQEAERVINSLHNKRVMGRRLVVSWANTKPVKSQLKGPTKVQAESRPPQKVDRTLTLSNEEKIRMIERKLQRMDDDRTPKVNYKCKGMSKRERTSESDSNLTIKMDHDKTSEVNCKYTSMSKRTSDSNSKCSSSSGCERTVNSRAIRSQTASPSLISGNTTDRTITEQSLSKRRRAEQTDKCASNKYRTISSNSDSHTVVTDNEKYHITG